MQDIDLTALIIRYQPEEEELDLTERNDARVRVLAKNTLLNCGEAIPNYLWQIKKYFPNRRSNRKRIFFKIPPYI